MSFTDFRIILAVMTLSFATYIFVVHYALLTLHIRNKIKKTSHRVPSGIALAPLILAALACLVSGQSEIICYWAISIVVFDPMNWIILAAVLREALGKVRKES
jgi:hypothetical protein